MNLNVLARALVEIAAVTVPTVCEFFTGWAAVWAGRAVLNRAASPEPRGEF
jgi:hypothetical protein